MDSFRGLLITLACVALFGFALLNFGYGMQKANNINNTILGADGLSSLNSSISSNLDTFHTSSDAHLNATMDEQGSEQQPTGALTLGSIFHSISTFGGFILGFGNSILNELWRLGVPSTVVFALAGILVVIALFTFWRVLKAGW